MNFSFLSNLSYVLRHFHLNNCENLFALLSNKIVGLGKPIMFFLMIFLKIKYKKNQMKQNKTQQMAFDFLSVFFFFIKLDFKLNPQQRKHWWDMFIIAVRIAKMGILWVLILRIPKQVVLFKLQHIPVM